MTKPDTTAADPEVIVMLRLKFKPGALDHVLAELVPIALQTREETGNVEFQVFRAKDDNDRLVLFERWTNQAALDAHWQLDYTKRVLALFEEHLVRPLSPTEDVTYLDDTMALMRTPQREGRCLATEI
ncbi:MAG: antibiotic biosynthesis monooxygenase [Caulobacteraceae bacterium]|nr:antibiotic biosynthesis monooxygenase [Caulobacteraceae bacterium]